MSTTNFNLSTEKNSGNKVSNEGVDFIVMKDGNGGEIKLLNLENNSLAPREGIIELTPLKYSKGLNGKLRHENEASFTCIRDKKTGWQIGIPLAGYHGTNKDIKFERIYVKGTEFLDLSIPKQRLMWICIKNGPFLKGSPNFQSQSKTIYEAVDRERQAVEFHTNRRNKRKAVDIAESLHGQELIDIATALNFDPKSMSTTQLEMAVIKYAEDTSKVNGKTGSERFLEIYNSDTRVELTILNRAIKTGLVTLTRTEGYSYNGVSLGFSEYEAVQFLKKSPQMLNAMELRSKTVNDASTQAFEVHTPPVVKDEKDIEIERLKKQFSDMEELLKKTSLVAGEAVSKKEVNDIDSELSDLIEEAKRLQIKGSHLIGKNDDLEVRKQKIRAKIAEATSPLKN